MPKTIVLKEDEIEKVNGGRKKPTDRKKANEKKSAPGISKCPQCGEPKLSHRVCLNCGYYEGKGLE